MKSKYIDEIINDNKYTYYAHRKESNCEKELLSSHLKLTYMYYKKMEKYKKLDDKVIGIIKDAFGVEEEIAKIIYEYFESAIYYHDAGKINPLFQKDKMLNDLGLTPKFKDSTHAALSARIYIDCMQKNINEENIDGKSKILLYYAVYYFGYIISRHHTNLESITELADAIKGKNIPQIFDGSDELYEIHLNTNSVKKFFDRFEINSISLYILCKVLYSCLVSADFYATYEYMTGNTVPIDTDKNDNLFDKYDNSDLIKSIRKYENKEKDISGINKLRSDIFLEAEHNLLKNINNDIFYIEAPTGAGKTNMAINIAKILYKNNPNIKSIQYIFPFNAIIEQTDNTFGSYFDKFSDYMVINSVSSMVKDINENLDYEQFYIKNVFKHFPIIITSHVNLFNTLFGTGKEPNYGLYHLIDSVIVIDEIQAYSNKIWREMIEMFSKYSSLLNIKFVIMSATLPRLDNLLNKDNQNSEVLNNSFAKFYALIQNTNKYYQNEIFKNRVILNFDLLGKKIAKEELIKFIIMHKDKKVLVECIKKDTADELYKLLSNEADNVQILTGDDNKYRRNEIIKMSKQDEPIIIVATQTIEAGVDIDMDIGFKDISFIDGEEQFIGRINRSSKKKNCIAYFYNMDDARGVYKSDNRLEFSLEKEEVRQWLKNKEFDKFYNKVLTKIYEKSEEYTNENIENFFDNCKYINYKKIQKKMELIRKDDSIQLFLNYTIDYNGSKIKGCDVFEEYKSIYLDDSLGYAEKKIKLSSIAEKMSLFMYTIYSKDTNIIEGEQFGNMYYIENGEDYIENGRFNRAKYLGNGDGLFL